MILPTAFLKGTMPHGLLNLAEPAGPSTFVPAVEQPAKVVTKVFGPGIK